MKTASDEIVRAERIDYHQMVDAIEATGNAFTSLLYGLHPEDGEKKVPQLDWNVAETAVHMLTIVRRGLGDHRRSETIPGLADLNAACVAEVETRLPLAIADALTEDTALLLTVLRAQSADEAYRRGFPLHAGLRANIPTALSYMLFDFMAHGLDIARAVGSDWVIEARHAALGLHASLPALGPWARSEIVDGPLQRLTIGFPQDDTATILELGNGDYRAYNRERAAIDDLAELDPVETFLAVAGRKPASNPVAVRLASWFEPI